MKLYLCVYEYGGYDYCMPEILTVVALDDEAALEEAIKRTGLKGYKWDVGEIEVEGYEIQVKEATK
jgi:hypothetical protein